MPHLSYPFRLWAVPRYRRPDFFLLPSRPERLPALPGRLCENALCLAAKEPPAERGAGSTRQHGL